MPRSHAGDRAVFYPGANDFVIKAVRCRSTRRQARTPEGFAEETCMRNRLCEALRINESLRDTLCRRACSCALPRRTNSHSIPCVARCSPRSPRIRAGSRQALDSSGIAAHTRVLHASCYTKVRGICISSGRTFLHLRHARFRTLPTSLPAYPRALLRSTLNASAICPTGRPIWGHDVRRNLARALALELKRKQSATQNERRFHLHVPCRLLALLRSPGARTRAPP